MLLMIQHSQMHNFNNYLVEEENLDQVNDELGEALDSYVPSIVDAFQTIRSILISNGLTMPETYEFDTEGDECVFELNPGIYLYVIFYHTDDGQYDIFAEVTDEEGLAALMSEDTTEE
jgi:hypothetical protein